MGGGRLLAPAYQLNSSSSPPLSLFAGSLFSIWLTNFRFSRIMSLSLVSFWQQIFGSMSTNSWWCFFSSKIPTSSQIPEIISLLCALLNGSTRDQTTLWVAILYFYLYLYLLLHYLYLLRVLLYAGTGDQTALGDLSSSPAAIGILSAANVTLHYFTYTPIAIVQNLNKSAT